MIDRPTLELRAAAFMLAFVAWREGSNQPLLARIAIMYSILNRVERPKWWGRSVLEVVSKRWQYSAMTAPKDVNLVRWPQPGDPSWWETYQWAHAVQDKSVQNPMPGADSYHDETVAPFWTATARFCGKLGKMSFYDVDHDYEAP
jgi:hypothetical protein